MYQRPVRIIILSMGLFIVMLGCEPSFKREDAFATEEKGNSTFSVRVTAYRERRDFAQVLGCAYYVFEAKNRDERAWKQFMIYKYDDPISIDTNGIVLVNERTGYIFMLRKFAVTTNGGISWSIWDAGNIQPSKADLSCRIQTVNIAENGTGAMDMKCNESETVLSTKDFGVTWKQ
jgi:hypothetical protein